MDFGIYFTKTEPTNGLRIPGTAKVNLPLVNWKGFMVIRFGNMVVYIKAEV